MGSLCLHRGAQVIDMEQLRSVATPEATATWTPVPHHNLVDSVKGGAVASGATIASEEHAVYNKGERALQRKAEVEAEAIGQVWTGGCPITVKHEGNGIRLLTDSEAAEYNATSGEQARKKLFRAFRRNQNVDVLNLDDNQLKVHHRTLEVQGRYVQALKQVRSDLRADAVKRMTPGVPG